jgi:formamidopyrimidine-DNA glycosylase
MPELAEVEFYKSKWADYWPKQEWIQKLHLNPQSRNFRDPNSLSFEPLIGLSLDSARCHGKRILFQFKDHWLSVHLGMTGRLRRDSIEQTIRKADHFILYTQNFSFIFNDSRQFGKVSLEKSFSIPTWFSNLPIPILSSDFDQKYLDSILKKKSKSLIKSALLDQQYFPGIGNYMADEILFAAKIHPKTKASDCAFNSHLLNCIKFICKEAIHIVAKIGGARDEMSSEFPNDWLFNQRWHKGGICPISKEILQREKISGRTTVWSAKIQKFCKALILCI